MSLADAHAVVAGVSQYRRISPLPQVVDAVDIAAVLRDPDCGGYQPDNVRLVQDGDATRADPR